MEFIDTKTDIWFEWEFQASDFYQLARNTHDPINYIKLFHSDEIVWMLKFLWISADTMTMYLKYIHCFLELSKISIFEDQAQLSKNDIKLFHHDIRTELSGILLSIQWVYAKYKKWTIPDSDERINLVLSYIHQSFPTLIKNRIAFFTEKGCTWCSQIKEILWYEISSEYTSNTPVSFQTRLLDVAEVSMKHFGLNPKDLNMNFDFDFHSIPEELAIIIDNLVRDSVKSYHKSFEKWSHIPFSIMCKMIEESDGRLRFAIGDNGWWLNREAIVKKSIEIIAWDPIIYADILSDRVYKILTTEDENKLNKREIRELIFLENMSTFGTTGIWLSQSRKILRNNWGDLKVREWKPWNILFIWDYRNMPLKQ